MRTTPFKKLLAALLFVVSGWSVGLAQAPSCTGQGQQNVTVDAIGMVSYTYKFITISGKVTVEYEVLTPITGINNSQIYVNGSSIPATATPTPTGVKYTATTTNTYASGTNMSVYLRLTTSSGFSIGSRNFTVDECARVSAVSADDPTIKGNTFCQNANVILTASETAFGANVKWYKNGVVIEDSEITTIAMPWNAGVSETYTVKGDDAEEDITLTSKACCTAGGQAVAVFEEHFSGLTYNGCGTRYADITAEYGSISTHYQYAPNSNGCQVEDGQYAVVETSYNAGHWGGTYYTGTISKPEVKEHTKLMSEYNTPEHANSGALMINAGPPEGGDSYFYSLQLTNLCSSATYEFSAWYVSLAYSDEIKPNITFRILENSTVIVSDPTGDVPNDFTWKEKKIAFTASPGTNTYTLQLKNNAQSGGGNDLMIDDIVVTKCVPTVYLYLDGSKETWADLTCNNEEISLSVPLIPEAFNAIRGGGTSVFAQLMSSADNINWARVEGALLERSSAGEVLFKLDNFAESTVYYRVNLSNDEARAKDPGLWLGNCYNDVITQTFKLTVGESLEGSISYPQSIYCTTENTAQTPSKSIAIPNGGIYSANGLDINSTTGSITPSGNAPGEYEVTYTVSVSAECEYNFRTPVTIVAPPALDVPNKTAIVCEPATADITALVVNATNCTAITYLDENNATVPNPAAVDVSGKYYIKATNTSACNDVTEEVEVIINPSPQLIEVSAECTAENLPQITKIEAQDGTPPLSYSINGGNTYTDDLQLPKTVDFGVENNVVVKDANECISNTLPITLHKPQTPQLQASGDLKELNESSADIELYAVSWENYYLWEKTEGNTTIIIQEGNTTINPAINRYDFIVKDNIGKTATYSVKVQNSDKCFSNPALQEISVSTLFTSFITPNGDGVNDIFAEGYTVKIFDRLGKLVYNSGSKTDGWNGGINNNLSKLTEPGVYFYVIQWEQRPPIRGSIEVVKK